MIFHEIRLLETDSHEIYNYYTLFFSKNREDVAKFVVCCSRIWRFKGLCIAFLSNLGLKFSNLGLRFSNLGLKFKLRFKE